MPVDALEMGMRCMMELWCRSSMWMIVIHNETKRLIVWKVILA